MCLRRETRERDVREEVSESREGVGGEDELVGRVDEVCVEGVAIHERDSTDEEGEDEEAGCKTELSHECEIQLRVW